MQLQQIIQELDDIPEDKLAGLYELIHHFKLELIKEKQQERKPGILQGTLSDSFFDPLFEQPRIANNGADDELALLFDKTKNDLESPRCK